MPLITLLNHWCRIQLRGVQSGTSFQLFHWGKIPKILKSELGPSISHKIFLNLPPKISDDLSIFSHQKLAGKPSCVSLLFTFLRIFWANAKHCLFFNFLNIFSDTFFCQKIREKRQLFYFFFTIFLK